MAQQTLIDAFDDCMNRISDGTSLEDCLLRYPAYANQLRPLLEASMTLPQIRVPESELLEDQALVWQQITKAIPVSSARRRRGFPFGLLAAVLLLIGLLAATGLFLTRPQLPDDNNVIIETATETVSSTQSPKATFTVTVSPTPSTTMSPTATVTVSPTSSVTMSPTATVTVSPTASASATQTATHKPTLTLTISPTITPTSTPTKTRIPLPTKTPTATFAPGCGAPLTEVDAINRVLAIYPNTSIVSASQSIKFGGTLVWEIRTSHNIEVNIDVACGIILTIEQRGTNDNANSNLNANSNDNTNDNDVNANDNVGGTNTNDNNSDTNSNDNSGSDDSDDSGGMGSDG